MTHTQDALFSVTGPAQAATPASSPLTARSTLAEALVAFRIHMQSRRLADNTIKSFQYDLNLLARHLGKRCALGSITQAELEQFVHWLQHTRGVACNAKSLARRITTLKVFFGWLAESGALPADPAAGLIQLQVSTPLPDILHDDQLEQLLAATHALRRAEKADARPHLLVSLLLATGIKKSECMAIVLNHLDFSEPAQPAVWIRYANPRYRLKERKLKLEPSWPGVLAEYKAQYPLKDKLFPCTARNLEYVLADASQLAGLSKQVSFEMLRWTCAVRDFRAGLSPDELRRKLGLSKITWREAGKKITQLAGAAL